MVTAQDLARTLRARSAEQRSRAKLRADRLCALLPQAATLLVDRYRAGRVVLFGSLAEETYSEHSDVDLAVEGMPSASYFEALAELMCLFGGPVDLVRIEDAAPSLRAYIEEEGRLL
jgi:predicted nucleotidyltransferase